jgi:hypothetical protein
MQKITGKSCTTRCRQSWRGERREIAQTGASPSSPCQRQDNRVLFGNAHVEVAIRRFQDGGARAAHCGVTPSVLFFELHERLAKHPDNSAARWFGDGISCEDILSRPKF